MSFAVELRGVTKDYETAGGAFRALKTVDLQVRAGNSWRWWAAPAPASRRS